MNCMINGVPLQRMKRGVMVIGFDQHRGYDRAEPGA
jgi:hypothetical protein